MDYNEPDDDPCVGSKHADVMQQDVLLRELVCLVYNCN